MDSHFNESESDNEKERFDTCNKETSTEMSSMNNDISDDNGETERFETVDEESELESEDFSHCEFASHCKICDQNVRSLLVLPCSCEICITCSGGRECNSDCLKCPVHEKEYHREEVKEIESKVFCLNKEEGCPYQDHLCKMKIHNKKCGYATIECPNFCGSHIKRKEVLQHLVQDCDNRNVQCDYCRMHLILNAKKKHEEEMCQQVPVSCKFCHEKREKCNIDNHEKNCKHQIVECKFKGLGCTSQYKIMDMEKHDSILNHQDVLIDCINKLNAECGELQDGQQNSKMMIEDNTKCIKHLRSRQKELQDGQQNSKIMIEHNKKCINHLTNMQKEQMAKMEEKVDEIKKIQDMKEEFDHDDLEKRIKDLENEFKMFKTDTTKKCRKLMLAHKGLLKRHVKEIMENLELRTELQKTQDNYKVFLEKVKEFFETEKFDGEED